MAKRFVVPFAATGDKTVTPDATDPGGAISYSQGWPVAYQLADTDPSYRPVGRQEMNGVLNDVTGAIAEIQQLGLPEWVAVTGLVTPYAINAMLRHNARVWRSLITNNSDEPGVGAGITSWEDITSVVPTFYTIDASAAPVTLTLPASNAALGVTERIYRRTDIVTTNAAVIAATGTDKIMLDTSVVTTGVAQTELIFGGDYLRLRSDGAGKWWCVGQAPLPASIASGSVKYATVGVFTFTVPPVLRSGRRLARLAGTGSGGGGGGCSSSTGAAGGGGGAGATGLKLVDLTGITSVTVTIPAGGAGGVGNAVGTGGSVTSFGTILTANGGSGGIPSPGGSAASGAGAGTSAGADTVVPGGAGKYSLVSNGVFSAGGVGGDSYYGKGASAPLVNGTAVSAINGIAGVNGAGGSGAASYNATANGGPGGPGILTADW